MRAYKEVYPQHPLFGFFSGIAQLASDFNLNIYHLTSYWDIPEKQNQKGGEGGEHTFS